MANSIARPAVRTRLTRKRSRGLIGWLLHLDDAHRQRTKLVETPDHRLHDMGIQRRDAAKAWNPPPMFLR